MTTVVVGGGLAGALAARAIDLAGEDIVVVDAAREPGGIARPVRKDGYLLEPAVGSVRLPHPQLSRLIEGLTIQIRPVASSARFVHHRGRTTEIRPGPGLVTAPLVTPFGKLRAAVEPLLPPRSRPNESLEELLVRRLGREAGRLVGWLMAAGVHAGDPSALSAEAAFPAVTQLERQHGSLLRGAFAGRKAWRAAPTTHVVEGGLAEIAGAVARSLGERWKPSWPVGRLEQAGEGWRVHGLDVIEAKRVIAAVTPEILSDLDPSLAPAPIPTDWAPVAVVWLGVRSPVLPDGFGVLIGPEERFLTLGFLYESSYAPDRAPPGRGLIKAIVGGAVAPGAASLDEHELTEKVTDELARVLGSTLDVDMTHVVRHHPGIPQYTVSRHHMVKRLRATLPAGLDVCGWAYDGVGLSHLAAAATRLAKS
jgi:oxygen-dependent protoporphyrinogen oxidase